MRASDLMTTPVHTCRPDETLAQAAERMWAKDCGCLPVIEADGAGQVVGMITDRDICMSALFQGRPLHEVTVSDAMSKNLKTCRSSDSLATVECVMQEAQIRRLPVVADNGSLVGLLTLGDLAREAQREQHLQKKELCCNEISTTLASICAPARQVLSA
jgi:CBS domain-containing protein